MIVHLPIFNFYSILANIGQYREEYFYYLNFMALYFSGKDKPKKEIYNITVDFVRNYVLSIFLKNLYSEKFSFGVKILYFEITT